MGGQSPKYPYTAPPPGDGQPTPDQGKDLWGLVPTVTVAAPWNTTGPWSFNQDPNLSGGSGAHNNGTYTGAPYSVDLASLRTAMASMLGDLQSAIDSYNTLKTAVAANKDHVYGQNAVVANPGQAGGAHGDGAAPTQYDPPHLSPSPIQPAAVKFAAEINPAQERVLEQIANSIELAGRFVASVDKAGQDFSSVDRKNRFPAPPAH